MVTNNKRWYSVGISKNSVRCSKCNKDISQPPSLDHHLFWCPFCKVECIIFFWEEKPIQIIPQLAPVSMQKAIKWAQNSLDELEFVELLVSLEEIAGKYK